MGWFEKFQEGCTGATYLLSLIDYKIDAEECCNKHDLEYKTGGTWREKFRSDLRLYKCLYEKSDDKWKGVVRVFGAFITTTFIPYAYVVWGKK